MAPADIPKWTWVPREVEAKLCALSGKPGFFIHVRGRRRMGKSSTVRRVLESRASFLILHEGDNFVRIRAWLKDLDVPVGQSVLTEGDLAGALCTAIRNGHRLVIDEIYRASPALQCALQDVVDTITYEVEHLPPSAVSLYGGLIVLGSHPILVDEVLEGSTRPLFRRFLSKITILPFLATEMATVFSRYGIANPMTQLATYATTGCCPLFIRSLVETGAFTDGAGTADFGRALFASHAQSQRDAVSTFYSDELRSTHAAALAELYRDQSRSSEPNQLKAIAKRLGFADDVLRAKDIVSALEARHGSVRLLQPIAPSLAMASRSAIRTQYVVTDAPLRTFHTLFAQAASGVHALSAPVAPEHVSAHEGHLLEEWVRQLIHERAATTHAPLPIGSVARLSQPEVVFGTWAGFDTVEIDVVVFFHRERIVVLGTVKRDAGKALSNWRSLFGHAARLSAQLEAAASLPGSTGTSRNEGCLREYKRVFVAFAPSFSREQRDAFDADRDSIAKEAVTLKAVTEPVDVMLCGLDDLLRFPEAPVIAADVTAMGGCDVRAAAAAVSTSVADKDPAGASSSWMLPGLCVAALVAGFSLLRAFTRYPR